MYFTVCSMLTMYFKMAVQHSSVENIRCYIVGFYSNIYYYDFTKEHLSWMLCLDSRKGVIDFSAKNGEKEITIL